MKKLIIVSLFLLIVTGCQKDTQVTRQKAPQEERFLLPAKGKPITIFIHGGAKPFSSLLRLPGLYDVCPQGIYLSSQIEDSTCLGRRLSMILNEADPEQFSLNAFYVLGWSGLLSPTAREKAGKKLYHFIERLRSYPCCQNVPLTLIGYSHGGNVALAAAIAALENNDRRTLVDRLIIMACPVVVPTESYIPSPLFKEVIALYSKSDPFQVSDFQGFYIEKKNPSGCTLFSQRRFDPSTHLVQAEIKLNNRSRTGHLGFISKRVLDYFPQILRMLEDPQIRKTLPRDYDSCYCLSINTKEKTVEGCKLRGKYHL